MLIFAKNPYRKDWRGFKTFVYLMTRLLTQILAAGGLLPKMVLILVLLALRGLLAGSIAVTCVALVLFQMLVDKGYRSNLFARESDKQKLLNGNGS